jgi:hypothetical protein
MVNPLLNRGKLGWGESRESTTLVVNPKFDRGKLGRDFLDLEPTQI